MKNPITNTIALAVAFGTLCFSSLANAGIIPFDDMILSRTPGEKFRPWNQAIAATLESEGLSSKNPDVITDSTGGGGDSDVKYPLEAFTFGVGLGAKLPGVPVNVSVGVGVSNAKLHYASVEYRSTIGLNIGASFLYGNAKKSYNDSLYTTKHTMIAGLVDVTYMFDASPFISPYLGVNAGYGKHEIEISMLPVEEKEKFNSFIWGIKAGSEFAVTDSFKLDLSYKMLAPGFKERKSKMLHNLSLGMNFYF